VIGRANRFDPDDAPKLVSSSIAGVEHLFERDPDGARCSTCKRVVVWELKRHFRADTSEPLIWVPVAMHRSNCKGVS